MAYLAGDGVLSLRMTPSLISYLVGWLIIPHIDSDDGDRASFRNVGFLLNIDTADCPRLFFIV
jgi:hypothetical protein